MKKALSIIVVVILLTIILGANALNSEEQKNELFYDFKNLVRDKNRSTHSVLIGVATSQNCYPCDYMNSFIYNLFNNETHDFYYVDMIVYDYSGNVLNSLAKYWANKYNIYKQPTLVFDGGYKKHIGYKNLDQIIENIEECETRDVWDLDADMNIIWLGDANIQIDINIKNNENEEYSFYLRTFITEKNSRYKTYNHNIYHYGFLDFAIYGETITIPAGDTYSLSEIWNGHDHHDGHGNDFGDIYSDNILVVTGIYRGNSPTHYIDQTIAVSPISGDSPNKPDKPIGPRSGSVGISYTYSTFTTDPQNDKIYYLFDWGDGSNTGWIGPMDSGKRIEAEHSWETKDNFGIRVKSKDIQGHESLWSDSLSVNIPRYNLLYLSVFYRFIIRILGLEKLLKT
jgi:hypothetical protein